MLINVGDMGASKVGGIGTLNVDGWGKNLIGMTGVG